MLFLRGNKYGLQKLAVDELAKKGGLDQKHKKNRNKIEGYLKLLKLVTTAITIVEGYDQYPCVIMKQFHDVQKSFEKQFLYSSVLKTKELAFKAVLAKRKDFKFQKVHLMNLLNDTCYEGCHIGGS